MKKQPMQVLSFLLLLLAGGTLQAQKPLIEIFKPLTAPVIDGIEEETWNNTTPIYLEKFFLAETPSVNAYWKALWSDSCLYVLVNVNDDDHYPAWESGGNMWEYEWTEVYMDLNQVLEDGFGPMEAHKGHWQFAPGFLMDGYDRENYNYGWQGHNPNGYYAHSLSGENYVYEVRIPFSSLYDENWTYLTHDNMINRVIGFDVSVTDRDEGTTQRQRMVWWNDGSLDGKESWDCMDGSGMVIFRDETGSSSNDSILCDSTQSANILFEIPLDSIQSYAWITDGGSVKFEDNSHCRIQWNSSGEKHVRFMYTSPSGHTDTLERTVIVHPKLDFSLGNNLFLCKGASHIFSPQHMVNGVQPFQYLWNGVAGDREFQASFDQNSSIRLQVKDAIGCSATDGLNISVTGNPVFQGICLITVDEKTRKNKIIWNILSDNQIQEYRIYRESSQAGIYELIGSVAAQTENYYLDTASHPERYAERYRMASVDTCGNPSGMSTLHQPIHLQITPGLPGFYNLNWSGYSGFLYTTYYIYKGRSPDQLELIDEVSSNVTQYTDTAALVSYYQVAVRRNEPCNPLTGKSTLDNVAEARSNMISTGLTGVCETSNPERIVIYPNPAGEYFSINERFEQLIIYNSCGVMVGCSNGTEENRIDVHNLAPGFYYIKIWNGNKMTGVGKVIKNPF